MPGRASSEQLRQVSVTWLAPLSLAAAIALAFAPSALNAERPEELVDRAFRLYEDGRKAKDLSESRRVFQSAIPLFREYLASDPDGERAQEAAYTLGMALLLTGEMESAEREFRYLIETDERVCGWQSPRIGWGPNCPTGRPGNRPRRFSRPLLHRRGRTRISATRPRFTKRGACSWPGRRRKRAPAGRRWRSIQTIHIGSRRGGRWSGPRCSSGRPPRSSFPRGPARQVRAPRSHRP